MTDVNEIAEHAPRLLDLQQPKVRFIQRADSSSSPGSPHVESQVEYRWLKRIVVRRIESPRDSSTHESVVSKRSRRRAHSDPLSRLPLASDAEAAHVAARPGVDAHGGAGKVG